MHNLRIDLIYFYKYINDAFSEYQNLAGCLKPLE